MGSAYTIKRIKEKVNDLQAFSSIKINDDEIRFDFTSVEFFIVGFAAQLIEGKTINPNPFEKQRILTPFIVKENKWYGHEVTNLDLANYPILINYAICLEKLRQLVLKAMNRSNVSL